MTNKTNRIYIRLDDRETEALQTKAEKLGMSIGVYLRFIGLNVDFEISKEKTKLVGQKLYKSFKPYLN